MKKRESNLMHDYHAVNSVDGRKLREGRINNNRVELAIMYIVAAAAVIYTGFCWFTYGAI